MSTPNEVSSKKRPKKLRQVIANKPKARDPRFDARAGDLNEAHFHSMYSFVDEQRTTEIRELRKRLKKTKSAQKKAELQRALQSLTEQVRAKKQKVAQQKLKAQRNKDAKRGKDGKMKFHLKKSDEKKLSLLRQFELLKKEGKLEKVMRNRRKHNLQKDKKALSATKQ